MTLIDRLQDAQTRFQRWRERSTRNRIFGATITVGGLTGFVAATSMAKDMISARAFGAGDLLDAYQIAVSLPLLLVTMIASPLASVLVPAYIREEERDPAEAARLFEQAVASLAAVLLVVIALVALTADLWLARFAAGFPPDKLGLTRQLLFLSLPLLFIEGTSGAWVAVLNARERFFLGALAPIMAPLGALAALVFTPGLGVFGLAGGTVIGFAVKAVLVGSGLRSHHLRVIPRWPDGLTTSPAFRALVGQFLAVAAGQFFASAVPYVDQFMAASLAPGSVSSLTFGNKLIVPFQNIGSIALGTALLPYFSQLVARNDRAGLRAAFISYGRLILLASVPVTIVLVIASESIVRLLFQRGAFTADDAHRVARIQAMYALQIPFYLLGSVAARLIYSLQGNRLLLFIYAIGLAAHVALNLLLMRDHGAAGLALSLSLTHVVYLVLYAIAIRLLWRRRTWM